MFGEHLREQVESRLKFYESGDTQKKNADVMKVACAEVSAGLSECLRALMLLCIIINVSFRVVAGGREAS